MDLRLQGHLSRVDNYGKLRFTFLDDTSVVSPSECTLAAGETRRKLLQHCSGTDHGPIAGDEFIVCLPSGHKQVPADILGMIGLDCSILVRVSPYSFVSRLERNAGEQVKGVRLILKDITY